MLHDISTVWLTLNKHFFFSWVSPFAIFLLKRNFFEILHYSSYLFLKTPKPFFYLFDRDGQIPMNLMSITSIHQVSQFSHFVWNHLNRIGHQNIILEVSGNIISYKYQPRKALVQWRLLIRNIFGPNTCWHLWSLLVLHPKITVELWASYGPSSPLACPKLAPSLPQAPKPIQNLA